MNRVIRRLVSLRIGIVVLLVGLAIVIAGLAYDVMFAGIPFQDDPGPEIAKRYAESSAQAGAIYDVGGKVMAVGLAWVIVVVVVRLVARLRARAARPPGSSRPASGPP